MTAQFPATAAGPFSTTSIGTDSKDDEDDMTYSDVSRQLTLILNVLVSIIFCAVSIWLAAWHWPIPTRLFASMSGAIVVGVAEVVIYAGYIRRLREARTKERKKPETKSITETWVIERGINGGSKASGAKKLDVAADQQQVRLRKIRRN